LKLGRQHKTTSSRIHGNLSIWHEHKAQIPCRWIPRSFFAGTKLWMTLFQAWFICTNKLSYYRFSNLLTVNISSTQLIAINEQNRHHLFKICTLITIHLRCINFHASDSILTSQAFYLSYHIISYYIYTSCL